MSSTGDRGEGSAADHDWFRAVEELFVDLRGAPLLLSPEDWRVAREWRRRGIPFDLLRGAMEEVFAARARRGGRRRRINSLRYVAPAVEKAWERARELAAGAAPSADAEPPSPGPRLARLAARLPEALAGREALAQRVVGLSGSPEEVEEALAELDRELIRELAEQLDRERHRRIEASVEAAVGTAAARLSREEAERARRQLLREAVRREWGAPILSLYSVDAME